MYFRNQAANLQYNFYANNTRTAGRILIGLFFGISIGYLQFGDR